MRKKHLFLTLMGAIALTGTVGFTSCSSDDTVAAVEDNPTYDPVANTVTSQFVLNIASDTRNNNSTRVGGNTVQAGGENFRGIDNAVLFAYKTGTAITNTTAPRFVTADLAAANAANRYDLGKLLAAGAINNDGENSHRILELSVPAGTDAMLFYGKAIRGDLANNDNEAGKVTYNISGKKATDFSFALNSRIASENVNRYTYTAELLAAIMTKIINVEGSYTVNTTTYPDWTSATLTSTWKNLNPTAQDRALSPMEEVLYNTFRKLTTIGGTELRGGSSKAIITTVTDLRAVVHPITVATPTSPYEELAKDIATKIEAQIDKYFTISSTPFSLKDKADIKTAYGTTDWNANWDNVDDAELKNFPVETFNLPEGAAILTYNGESTNNVFTRKTSFNSLIDKSTTSEPTVYQYPAELMYYANSGVRTSDKEKSASDFPNGVAKWDDKDNTEWDSDWKGNVVTSSTRATALKQNVNYGVALLKTTVGIKSGLTVLEDNRNALSPDGELNKTFTPANIDFTLTGIIVGGQPASVDWQFLPPSTSTFDKLVYDNRIKGETSGTAVPKEAGSISSPNYTILFDNYNSGGTQNKVRVALQFVNNGDDFWGRDNLIRKGQTFYMVGELDPTGKTIADWDTYYQVPPLTAAGVSTQTTRVFVQDYQTVANFWITSSSLQNAFVTLPDLRSSQLSFGLSVDIDWRPGVTYDVDLGGN